MIQTTPWQLQGVNGQPIFGDTDHPESKPRSLAILCHGFKGYKDYGFFPMLGRRIAEAGVLAIRFNFSHAGMTRRVETFERLDLFEQDRYSFQVQDLHTVARAAFAGEIGETPSANLPQIWFGHSRGGFGCVHAAERVFHPQTDMPATPKPKGLILAAARARPQVTDQQRSDIERQGFTVETSGRTGQDIKIGKAWLDDIDQHPTGYDAVQAITRIPCPIAVIHGTDDNTVPFEDGQELAQAAAHATLHRIEQGTHTFNAPNPLPVDQTPPPQTREMIDICIDFVQQQFAEG